MSRGVKRARNFNDEIAELDAKIATHESKIKTLKSQLTSILKEREQSNLQELNRLLNESGLTVDELTKLISRPKIEIA